MAVADGGEFTAPGTVKIEDEYIIFTGVNNNTLTGCSPGAYGTAPAGHAAGERVSQVEIFAEPADGSGLPADEIFLRLLCVHGGIDPLAIAVADRNAVLTQSVSSGGAALPVNLTEPFPETGIARVDDELIRYRGISGSALQVAERGAYGTAAAAHGQGAAVKVSRFTEELGRWMANARYRRRVEEATPVKELVNSLREQCLVHVWQAEDSAIRAKCVAPPFYTDPPKELTDETGFIKGSTGWDPGYDLMATRIMVHYNPVRPQPGQKPEDYAGLLVIVDADAESADYFGESRLKEVWANWIYDEHEALLLASRFLVRYRRGAATFKFAVELKDDDLQVGDFARITSRDVTDFTGAALAGALFEVIKKSRVSDNRIEFTAMDTRLDKRYPVISPASLTLDYDQAGATERERYGWIGDADNRVGSPGEDGYYIY
jgi:hypothetical protein